MPDHPHPYRPIVTGPWAALAKVGLTRQVWVDRTGTGAQSGWEPQPNPGGKPSWIPCADCDRTEDDPAHTPDDPDHTPERAA